MGAQLVGYFEKIGAEFGATGRMKLAMLTLIGSVNAGAEEDSPENIRKFRRGDGSVEENTQEVGTPALSPGRKSLPLHGIFSRPPCSSCALPAASPVEHPISNHTVTCLSTTTASRVLIDSGGRSSSR